MAVFMHWNMELDGSLKMQMLAWYVSITNDKKLSLSL